MVTKRKLAELKQLVLQDYDPQKETAKTKIIKKINKMSARLKANGEKAELSEEEYQQLVDNIKSDLAAKMK